MGQNARMTTQAFASSSPASAAHTPSLANGDRLSRDEFERRYDATPRIKKAELIEGIVFMAPPALRWDEHARPDGLIAGWLMHYEAATPGVQMGHNASIRIDLDNEPQPDAALIILPECGGQSRVSADGYIEGAPELIVEVSASTVSIDMNAKLRVYRRNGVREYVVWRTEEAALDWFMLRGSEYVPLTAGPDGILRSELFPGLWLSATALLRRDAAGILEALNRGVAGDEHVAFVSSLKARHSSR